MNYEFYLYAIGFGISLAMDAFSVSLANGLHEPGMRLRRMCVIAGIFAIFQGLMPLLGWICVHTVVSYFSFFEALIPWISLGLLGYIGGKMLYDSIRGCGEEENCGSLTVTALLLQAVATSIDALSVGFTISEYNVLQALVACLVIGVLTFGICAAGVVIGKKFGTKLEQKASVFGGAILILIGLKIFLEGIGVLG